MRLFKSLLAVIVGIVILSFITGHGYVWGGIQETYFRGWKNSNIDDLIEIKKNIVFGDD